MGRDQGVLKLKKTETKQNKCSFNAQLSLGVLEKKSIGESELRLLLIGLGLLRLRTACTWKQQRIESYETTVEQMTVIN